MYKSRKYLKKQIPILIVIVAIALLVTYAIVYIAKSFGITWAVVASYSMEPTLEPGDIVIIKKVSKIDSSYLGRVIVYHKKFMDLEVC